MQPEKSSRKGCASWWKKLDLKGWCDVVWGEGILYDGMGTKTKEEKKGVGGEGEDGTNVNIYGYWRKMAMLMVAIAKERKVCFLYKEQRVIFISVGVGILPPQQIIFHDSPRQLFSQCVDRFAVI